MHTEGISVIVPVFNEEESVNESYRELVSIVRPLHLPYEIIYIDDGSRDQTFHRLALIAEHDSNVRVIQFRRNFGQTAAIAAGLDASRYSAVVMLDGDLQNDPHEIPKMLKKLQEGYDLVAGWRKNRKDKFLSRKLPSKIANKLISWSTNVPLHDYGCTLKVMTAEIAHGIRLYGEMHRFIPALAAEMGARIVEVPVHHRARKFGSSKYGISRTIRVVLDLLTVKFLLGYSKRPIHFFGVLGLFIGGLGSLGIFVAMIERFFFQVPMGNRPLVLLCAMFVIIGLQFVVFGLLAEVLARTYYESQNKRTYVIRRVLEQEEPEKQLLRKAAN